jgi:hypothetical protein
MNFRRWSPHLVLLDVNPPKFDGDYCYKQIRKVSSCPINPWRWRRLFSSFVHILPATSFSLFENSIRRDLIGFHINYAGSQQFSSKKKAFGIKSKGFLYAYFFQDLIQHHNWSQRKSLYFGQEFIYYYEAGKT